MTMTNKYSFFLSFRFIITKANHLKPTSAWLPIPYDQNYCVSKIQPNTQKRDGRRRFYRTINRLKLNATKTQVMWNQVGF